MSLPKWLSTLASIGPLVLAAIPGIPPALIPAIVVGISTAEVLAGTGTDKKAAVVALAGNVADDINAVKPGSIDPAALSGTVSSAIDTVVDVINLVHPKK